MKDLGGLEPHPADLRAEKGCIDDIHTDIPLDQRLGNGK
jgi:hypothetical protein